MRRSIVRPQSPASLNCRLAPVKRPYQAFLLKILWKSISEAGQALNFEARIDRVDRCGKNEYEVWDYKTGSKWGFRDEGYLNRGRHLQHALYAVAAEIILRRK